MSKEEKTVNVNVLNYPELKISSVVDITSTAEELNALHGAGLTQDKLQKLGQIKTIPRELNTLRGFTGSFKQMNYISTLRDFAQKQFDNVNIKIGETNTYLTELKGKLNVNISNYNNHVNLFNEFKRDILDGFNKLERDIHERLSYSFVSLYCGKNIYEPLSKNNLKFEVVNSNYFDYQNNKVIAKNEGYYKIDCSIFIAQTGKMITKVVLNNIPISILPMNTSHSHSLIFKLEKNDEITIELENELLNPLELKYCALNMYKI